MKQILDEIVEKKKLEIAQQKRVIPERYFEQSRFFQRFPLSFADHIKHGSGVVAEHKRKSPSKGTIHTVMSHQEVISGYQHAGASAVSVLTDELFFGGSLFHLESVRAQINIPILRKDFIIDPYQIAQSKAAGADAVLLIARILSPQQIQELAALAQGHGMEVLLELHDESELEKVNGLIDVIGVNNRNLQNFSVDLDQSIALCKQIPDSYTKIAESGISAPETAAKLKTAGFHGFLIGEFFMSEKNPPGKCLSFINKYNHLKNSET
ncbi:Indole-3-glycerol phosphate synthase [Salinivirga cyanobacteriivorans]|uniref:indole-3-glycerol-phosphate synthase n=1 Tax=Salinivirga cyanobacteriivorans TaxID=1307839 RepID=A0A0S2I1Z1_9BACT|nr:indole-3-glycerol phosphate synthase TrpC [Salinivirga cyanobacteriivorans]ALO16358.1 Indole-3-glycerol phosphate synthase [Salinivirga cyanobacteriivorans]